MSANVLWTKEHKKLRIRTQLFSPAEEEDIKYVQMYIIKQMYNNKTHTDVHEENPKEQPLGFPAILESSCGQPYPGEQTAMDEFLVPRLREDGLPKGAHFLD